MICCWRRKQQVTWSSTAFCPPAARNVSTFIWITYLSLPNSPRIVLSFISENTCFVIAFVLANATQNCNNWRTHVHVRYMSSSVRQSVCRLSSVVCLSSVTFVHPTQAIEIFCNVSTPFGTLAICDPSVKILWRSSQGNPSVGGLSQRGVYRKI